jgi:Glycosyl hydrolase family 1
VELTAIAVAFPGIGLLHPTTVTDSLADGVRIEARVQPIRRWRSRWPWRESAWLVNGMRSADPRSVTAADVSRSFPRGFLWGAAMASHQVEGGNVNNYYWEWEHVSDTPFVESSGDAVDHYHRWREDLDLLAGAGLTAYRFSLEWSRIEPEEGELSRAALEHYRRVVEGCRARGLAPVVTLNHLSTPRWFHHDGSWLGPTAADRSRASPSSPCPCSATRSLSSR